MGIDELLSIRVSAFNQGDDSWRSGEDVAENEDGVRVIRVVEVNIPLPSQRRELGGAVHGHVIYTILLTNQHTLKGAEERQSRRTERTHY